jgi:antitoxin ParD1/3/4
MLNVSLTPEAQTFIEEQLANGKYRSTDEVLLAGLELLAAKDARDRARYTELKQEIEVGLAEAEAGNLIDGEELFDRLRQKLQQQRQMKAND